MLARNGTNKGLLCFVASVALFGACGPSGADATDTDGSETAEGTSDSITAPSAGCPGDPGCPCVGEDCEATDSETGGSFGSSGPTTGSDEPTITSDDVVFCDDPFTSIGASPLPFRVFDAEYSAAQDAIIAIGNEPPALHRIDLGTGSIDELALPLPAAAVSVSPSGDEAVIGHDGWVSVVDLDAMALIDSLPTSADAVDVVHGGNGFAYVFPRVDQWETIRSVDLTTGMETLHEGSSIRAGTLARLHPDGNSIYGANNGLSPSDIEKYSIEQGNAQYLYDSPYHGDYAMCGNLWISDDGARIFTRCGNVFRTSTMQTEDMQYGGSLNETERVLSLSHSSLAGEVALIPDHSGFPGDPTTEDTVVDLYADEFLTHDGTMPIPAVETAAGQHVLHGRFVFHGCEGEALYVVSQLDPGAGALDDYYLVRLR